MVLLLKNLVSKIKNRLFLNKIKALQDLFILFFLAINPFPEIDVPFNKLKKIKRAVNLVIYKI
jgi:hypothetical protein